MMAFSRARGPRFYRVLARGLQLGAGSEPAAPEGRERGKEASKTLKRQEKEEFVTWLRGHLTKVPAVVLSNFQGLTVAQITDLRKRCREAGVEFKVVKNTLTRLAAKDTPLSGIAGLLEGPTAVAWHPEDPGAAARLLVDFAREKDKEAFQLKGAAAGARVFSADEVRSVLAMMPSRPELLARLAGLMNGGPAKLHRAIAAGPAMLHRVLCALKEQRPAAGG